MKNKFIEALRNFLDGKVIGRPELRPVPVRVDPSRKG